MAVAYSTLANAYRNGGNGAVVTPHLGMEIDESRAGSCRALQLPAQAPRAPERRRPEPGDGGHPRRRQRARRHLGGRVGGLEPGSSTRCSERRAPPSTTAKKTSPGTCATSATRNRPIVIAVTVEQGGFGAETAAPIARLIASQVVRRSPRSSSPGAQRHYELRAQTAPSRLSAMADPAAIRSRYGRRRPDGAVGTRTLQVAARPAADARRASASAICSVVTLGPATQNVVAGQPALLHRPAGGLPDRRRPVDARALAL